MANTVKERAVPSRASSMMMTALVEMGADGLYRVRLRGGELVRAELDDGIDPRLVEACMRERRRVVIENDGERAFILGALETRMTQPVAAERLELTGEDSVVLRAGQSELCLHANGKVTLRGNDLTMDVARLVKLLSAKVELP